MALDKPLEDYIPGIPSGETVTVPATQVTGVTAAQASVEAIAGVTGTDVQAVLEDLAGRVDALENP